MRVQGVSYKEYSFVRLSEMLRAESGCLGETSTQGNLALSPEDQGVTEEFCHRQGSIESQGCCLKS